MLKINFLGDSITEGALATCEENTYVSLVGQMTNSIVRNYGIGGSRIAESLVPSEDPRWDRYFGSRVDEMNHDADLVFVFGGTNDFGHHVVEFGKPGDKTPKTFYGGVDYLVNKLLDHYKKEQIVFIVPLYRIEEFNEEFEIPLSKYREVLVEIVKSYGIKILDIKDIIGKPFDNPLIGDGLHPTDLGHRKIAELICDYISKIKTK